jgi:hypothetical protein
MNDDNLVRTTNLVQWGTNLFQLDGVFCELAAFDAGLLNVANLDTGVLGLAVSCSNERYPSFHRRPVG